VFQGRRGGPTDDRVERQVVLPADREEVWAALTHGDRLSRWFGCEVEIEPWPGGRVTMTGQATVRRALVEEVEPLRRLVFRWLPDPGGMPRTRVEFALDPHPDGTLLTVVEAPLWPGGLQVRLLGATA